MTDVTLRFADSGQYLALLDQLSRDSDGRLTRRGIHDLVSSFAVEVPAVSLDERVYTPLNYAEKLRLTHAMDHVYLHGEWYRVDNFSPSPAMINACAEHTLILLERVSSSCAYPGNSLYKALLPLLSITNYDGLYSKDLKTDTGQVLGRRTTNLFSQLESPVTTRGENGLGKDRFKDILIFLTGNHLDQLASFKRSFLDVKYNTEGIGAAHLFEDQMDSWYNRSKDLRRELTVQAIEYARKHLNL